MEPLHDGSDASHELPPNIIEPLNEAVFTADVPRDEEPQEPQSLLRHEAVRATGIPLSLIRSITEELIEIAPEAIRFVPNREGRQVPTILRSHLHLVRERAPAPDGWTNEEEFAKTRGVTLGRVRRIISKLREADEPVGTFGRYKGKDDVVPREYFDEALSSKIDEILGSRQTNRQRRERAAQAEDEVRQFAEELKNDEGETSIEAEAFKKVLNVFGDDIYIALDVLFRLRKDWDKKTLMPVVNSCLAEYIGEFTIKKGELDLNNLPEVVDFLDDRNVQDALFGVMKRHCLKNYHQKTKEGSNTDDFETIADYLDSVREHTKDVESPELDNILQRVEDYYLSLFELEIPSKFVESLSADRPFPDLNQRINIREVQLEKRILIGDDPAMGKSASAIMSKEIVGSKCAVIVTPSIVFDDGVWQNYLKEYFKPDQQPRVLAVDHISKLENVSADDYDYIILSHSRMMPNYCDQLAGIDFDMLIVDEAHNFKNITEGVWSKQLLHLAEKIEQKDKHLIMLSATPVPNKVADIALPLLLLYPKEFKQYAGENGDYKELVQLIVHNDVLKIRGRLLPKMQAKLLDACVNIPEMRQTERHLKLTGKEREIYEILLDEWELEAHEKMRYLQQVLLNPAMLDATPDITGIKTKTVGEDLRKLFETKDKVVMYVNNYVEGVIKGQGSIISRLNIPKDVDVYTIYGEIGKADRKAIMKRFQEQDGKMLLIVSGQTVSVGVDLSAAQEDKFYNEPWTLTAKNQMIGRSQRPGRIGELGVTTYIVDGTIEEGIHTYINDKHRAVEKLLYGIPLTDLEKALVETEEKGDEESLAVNADLAEYYFSSQDRMNRIFGRVKEMGQDELVKFLDKHGKEYAKTYQDLTSRSYQANASRLAGSLITKFIADKKNTSAQPYKPVILDVGSGPEMLRRHITDEQAERVISLDINKEHFANGKGKRVAAAMAQLPIANKSVDYANLSLVWHYTAWQPSKQKYERLETLAELNRVLKPGGKAVFTLMYSLDIRDENAFANIARKLGFEVVENVSGLVQAGEHFKARVITLEKVADSPTKLDEVLKLAGDEVKEALRFAPRDNISLRDSRKMVDVYTIKDQSIVNTVFNEADRRVWDEEQTVLSGMKKLRDGYTKIEDIPASRVIKSGFARIFNGKGYVLFKRLKSGDGAVVFRNH